MLHVTPDSIDVMPMECSEIRPGDLPAAASDQLPEASETNAALDSEALRSQFGQLLADLAEEEEALLRARQQAQRIERATQDAQEASAALKAALESSTVQRVRAQAAHAAKAVKSIKKHDLDEVRALHRPPRAVEKAMALLYWVLTPACLAASDTENTSEAEEQHLAAKLRWKEDLRPMLVPGLAQKIADFPPPEQTHPLLARPGVLKELLLRVALKSEEELEDGDDDELVGNETSAGGGAAASSSGLKSKNVAGSGTAAARSIRGGARASKAATSQTRISVGGATADRRTRASKINSDKHIGGEDGRAALDIDADAAPLTLTAVVRASRPVAALFDWVLSQFRLAVVLSDSASISGEVREIGHADEAAVHQGRTTAAENALARAGALQSMQELHALSEVTATVPPAYAARDLLQRASQPGPDGMAARRELEASVQRLDALKGRLGQLRELKREIVKEAEIKVSSLKQCNATLEARIQEVEAAEEAEREAALAASGPPKCEACGQEKVLRQSTLLNSEHFGRWYWRCNKCRTREYDDSIPTNKQELLARLASCM